MEDCDKGAIKNRRGNGMLMPILGGAVFVGLTLIMGSYGYIWSEINSEQDEKRQWRKEHQQVLDKKFEEVKEGQQKIENLVRKKEEDNNVVLKEILEEQKKMNRSSSRRSSSGIDR